MILLYLRTLRYLKLSQIYHRIFFLIFRPRSPSRSDRFNTREINGSWIKPASRSISLFGLNKFRFLNVEFDISDSSSWSGRAMSKLWLYNLHYFDDLNAFDAASRFEWHRNLIDRWVSENPPAFGIGWDPYPTSLRIVNWIKWHLSGNNLSRNALFNLVIQVRWLTRRIEWHILGNHLFSNGKALVFSGIFFVGPEATVWVNKGLKIINQELSEQVLMDGGHFERSPMYHAIFLEDLLDLINLSGAFPDVVPREQVYQWREIAHRMLKWFEAMCHPDGEITFFNDSAIGISPSSTEIFAYANRLGFFTEHRDQSSAPLSLTQFPESGYIRLTAMNAVAFLDTAHIGPDYLPGHAHADTLSFELSLFGERVLVNGGTSQYCSGPVRLLERGSDAHNTVTINGENSSEVWSAFRVARRAYPMDLVLEESEGLIFVSCAHDGYMRLPGKPVHKRSWQFRPGKLVVHDQVLGVFETAVAHFHFHPNIKVSSVDNRTYSLILPCSQQKIEVFVLRGAASLDQGFFAPGFGIRLENQCLSVEFVSGNEVIVEISWSINE